MTEQNASSKGALGVGLAVPFAAVGVALGFAFVGFRQLTAGAETWLRCAVVVGTPLAAAALGAGIGWALEPRSAANRPPGRSAQLEPWKVGVALTVATVAASGFFLWAALVLGVVDRESSYPTGVGRASGTVVVAIVVILAAHAMYWAARAVGRARHGSVVDLVDRRGVLLAVAVSAASCSLIGLPGWTWHDDILHKPAPEAVEALSLLAIVGIVALLVRDGAALLRVRRAAVAALGMTARDPDSSEPAASWVDLGVGDDVVERTIAPTGAYRGPVHVLAVVQGDPRRAERLVGRAVARDAAALVLGFACVFEANNLPRYASKPAPEPPPPVAVSSDAASGDAVGVAACDAYLAKMESCVKKMPSEAEAAMRDATAQNRKAWKDMASLPQARGPLESACKTALDALASNPACN